MKESIRRFKENSFLFSELIKRDFKKKYKRTYLGMLWSVLSPLLTLTVMSLIFTTFFGKDQPHYIIYLFCGNLVYSFFSDSTNGGMGSIMSNASVILKVPVPKYLFLLSRNISSLINFGLTFAVFLIFCAVDKISFTWLFFMLIIPIVCEAIFNIGLGLILSTLFVFFRDMQYLWNIFSLLIMYMSAIFYTVTPEKYGNNAILFNLNPIYVYISYFRQIVIEGRIPSIELHVLAVGYALLALAIGLIVYKKCNHKFVFYM